MNLVKMAWRNLWRNKLRSFTVIASVVIGLLAGIFASSLIEGMMQGRFDNFIEKEITHIQIHHEEFIQQPEVEHVVEHDYTDVFKVLESKGVKAATVRSKTQSMIASATYTAGVTITGVFPDLENHTTGFAENIIEGEYLVEGDRNRIIIGKALANKMNVSIGSRIVLTFQDRTNEMVSAAFVVGGIFETYYTRNDEANVFVPLTYLNELLQTGSYFHEMAILTKSLDEVHEVKESLIIMFPNATVRTWNQIAPELEYWVEIGSVFSYVFIIILMLGLAFGLLNTMLMAVFERTREIGMLMAIGMNKKRVFLLIVLETLILSVLGTILSIGLSLVLIARTSKTGIDLSAFSDVMQEIGFETMIYPKINSAFFLVLPFIVIAISLLAAIYPAIKALKLNPSDAVRK